MLAVAAAMIRPTERPLMPPATIKPASQLATQGRSTNKQPRMAKACRSIVPISFRLCMSAFLPLSVVSTDVCQLSDC